MGCRVTTTEKKSAMFDSVTGTAFGPVFVSEEECEDFIQWCLEKWDDPRSVNLGQLERIHSDWYVQSHSPIDDTFHPISAAVTQ